MDTPSASVREIATRLLTVEAAATDGSRAHEAVWEKLRVSLTRLAGAEAFTSLLRRALSLARAEIPALSHVSVESDGSLQGLEAIVDDSPNSRSVAAATITAYLLGLLVTFIGDALTMRLVREAWPDASWGDMESQNRGRP